MAEKVILSPGVYTREIEIFPTPTGPIGTPAGAIGSAVLGPAFVPITVGNIGQFSQIFGSNIDGTRQGIIAAREYLRNGTAFTYCRVLGAGVGGTVSSVTVDTTPNYFYERAGFVAGNENLNGVDSTNISGSWTSGGHVWYLYHAAQDVDNADLYIENLIESAGAPLSGTTPLTNAARASGMLLRGVLFTSGSAQMYLYSGTNATAFTNTQGKATLGTVGGLTGTIASSESSVSYQQFVVSIGSNTDADAYFGPITCSMDPNRGDYFANILNTDPDQFATKGHMLYARYDVDPTVVTMSGTSGPVVLGDRVNTAVSASMTSFYAEAYKPNLEKAARSDNFGSRFRAPISPTVISQPIGGNEQDLFDVESLHDGHLPSTTFKISIRDIRKPNNVAADPYGSFTLVVRAFNDTDQNPVIFEQYTGLNLNPNSPNFVCARIGTQKTYFDFDQADEEDRKLVTNGEYPNVSNFIRLVPTQSLLDGTVPTQALPFGFRAPSVQADPYWANSTLTGSGIPPVPFRQTMARGVHSTSKSRKRALDLYWGVQFEQIMIPSSGNGQDDPNASRSPNSGIEGFTKLFGLPENNLMVTGSGTDVWEGTTLNADSYMNNKFTLDNVALMSALATGYTTSNMTTVSLNDVKFFRYFRGGVAAGTASLGDLVNLSGADSAVDFNKVSAAAKFSFFIQHGFDGTNYQDRESRLLTNLSVKRADENETQPGGLFDNTVNAYLHAIQIMSNKDDVNINLFAIPGIKQSIVTDRAIDATEDNFDALYVMDIDDRLETDYNTISSVSDVLQNFEARSLDSSFTVAYYPDLVINDPSFGRRVTIAPSAAVLGAFAFTDRVATPFQATAGYTRGVLDTVVNTTQRLTQNDRDDLYTRGNINPIWQPPGRNFVIYGNKTLDANTDSALTRANTRRLLIEVRRAVRKAAEVILFDQNTSAAIDRLNQLIDPILNRIQAQGGIQQYRVLINDQTTGPVERENYTVAGKIFIQPTNTIENIALDFVIDPSGVTFNS